MLSLEEHGETPQDPEQYWLAALENIGRKVELLVSSMYPELALEIAYVKYAPNPGGVGAEYVRKIVLGLSPKNKSKPGFTFTITDPTDDYINNGLEHAIRTAHKDWKSS